MRRLIFAAALLLAACNKNNAEMNVSAEDFGTENAVEQTGPEPPKIVCSVIGERVAQDECDDINALSKDVKTGAAALDVPDPMTRGRESQVTLVVDRRPLEEINRVEESAQNATDTAELSNAGNAVSENNMEANAVAMNEVEHANPPPPAAAAPAPETPNQVVAQLPGQNYSFPSQVGRYMKATLAGQGFDVRLISPDDPVQEVPPGGQATWIWGVVPRQEGEHMLTARTEAVAIVNGRAKPLGNGQAFKAVNVRVRAIDRVHDWLVALPDWLKLIAAILTAATLVVVAWVKLQNAAKGDSK